MTNNHEPAPTPASQPLPPGRDQEQGRILALVDGLITHYADSHHPGLTRESRSSVLKVLRLLKGRITDER